MIEKIALQKQLISKADCDKAKAACRASEDYENALKDYFISNNLIDPATLEQLINTTDAIRIIKKTMKFGAVAVKMGFITDKTLESALEIQKKAAAKQKRPKVIGQILLESGKLTKKQIEQVVKEQKKINLNIEAAKKAVPKADESSKEKRKKKDAPKVSEELLGGMILDIEENGMAAFLRKTKEFDPNINVEDIYSILLTHSIQYGLVSETEIKKFVQSEAFFNKRFSIASGVPVIPGRDARIEYYFDTDHRTAGGLDKEGNIDFKDRGRIPEIEANTLLAEKFPLKESRNGRDIFGKELEAQSVRDAVLKSEEGVWISADGTKAYAVISGHPQLSRSGVINVVDTYIVNGDVGYDTGHIFYNGNVEIKGCLKSGFKINGINIKVNEIDGGEIYAKGDVTIINGVNNATIYSFGNVSAKYIHDAQIFCLGNVFIEKEIVDSEIENSGACNIKKGEIINSQISSAQGLFAKTIGSKRTNPNIILVGKDVFVENELKTIESKMDEFEEQKKRLTRRKEMAVFDSKDHLKSGAAIVNELDRISSGKRKTRKYLVEFEKDTDKKEKRNDAKMHLKKLETKFSRLEKDLEEHLSRIRRNEKRIKQITNEFDELENRQADLNQEEKYFKAFSDYNDGKSIVEAGGKVYSGTLIKTRHAKKEIKETISNAEIREARVQLENTGTNIFEIQIT